MDPQQELFTELLLQLKKTEYDVYDTFLPPEDTPYPFIYLADSQQSDRQTKGAVIGSVYQTIHVWHNNPRQRGTVSKMLQDIKKMHNPDFYRMKWALACAKYSTGQSLAGP